MLKIILYMRSRYILSLLLLFFSLSVCTSSSAQDAFREYVEPDGWSIGINAGLSDLWGDVGTKSIIQHYTNGHYFDKVAVLAGMFGRYTIHPCLAVRLQANYGALYATDKWNYNLASKATTEGDDAYQRYARAQNVKDDVFEGTLLFELTIFRINPESKRANKRGQPYIAAGFTYFNFTPYSTVGDGGTWVKVRPLDLEGQGWGAGYPKQFKSWQPAIPLAIGYRWDLGQHLNFGIEYMYRYTFTDYLDGVSGKYVDPTLYAKHLSPGNAAIAPLVADKGYYAGLEQPNAAGNLRGNPSNKDSYSTVGFTLYYKINTSTRRWWR